MRHRTKEYPRLMNSRAWRRLRASYLTAHPICQDCEAKGRTSPATEVHHILPIERYAGRPEEMKAIALDPYNLRALCHPCHVEAHKLLSSQSAQQAKERTRIEVEAFASTFLR